MNSRLTLLLTVISCSLCNTLAAQTPESILLEQHKNFQLLKSIEFKSTKSIIYHAPPNLTEEQIKQISSDFLQKQHQVGISTTHHETHFIAEGNKYYIQGFEKSSLKDAPPKARTITFNAKVHSMLNADSGRMDTTQKPIGGKSYQSHPGFLDPYGYLVFQSQTHYSDPTLTLLNNEAIWLEKAQTAIVAGETTVDGYEVVILDIMGTKSNSSTKKIRVYCAKDYGYYPIQTERIADDDSIMARLKVSGLKRHTAADGVQILLHESSKFDIWYNKVEGSPLRYVMDVQIDQDSLRFNEPIDDSVFENPVPHADVVLNVDTGHSYRVKEGNIITPKVDVSDISLAQADTNNNESDDILPVPQAKEPTTIEEPQQKSNPIYLGLGIMMFIALSRIILNKRKQKNT